MKTEPLYKEFHYPQSKPIEVDNIEQLKKLRHYIDNARKQKEHFIRLSSLPYLDVERLFVKDIPEQIQHWTATEATMIKCWNTFIETMKIK